jgi:plasmid maintenance system antidote protein VapI
LTPLTNDNTTVFTVDMAVNMTNISGLMNNWWIILENLQDLAREAGSKEQ